MTPKTFKIKSFGCQMNVYDGERMAELLGAQGMAAAADGEDADLVVLNTCHIREKAAEKAYSDVGRLRREDGSKPLIALAGCVAQAEGAEAQAPLADDRHRRRPAGLSPPARNGRRGRRAAAARSTPTCRRSSKFDALPARRRAEPERLPHRAGRLRQILHLLRRALHPRRRDLAAVGRHRRRGACAGRCGRARDRPARPERECLGATASAASPTSSARWPTIDGLERIRYTTSHPADMTDALIAAHGEVDKLMPYLHLPVQSGSDRILKAMNRSHTPKPISRMIEKMRAARPDIALSGDFIVGFPGETEEDFEATLQHRRCGRLRLGLFVQIQRPPGHSGGGDGGPDSARSDGRAAAAAAGADQRAQPRLQPVEGGRDTQILIERKGRRAGQMIGKSPWLQSVHVETDARARRHARRHAGRRRAQQPGRRRPRSR